MGFLNKGETWEHANDDEVLAYLFNFLDYNREKGAKWHRYVHSEHVKVIVERGYGNYFIVRSIFRSMVFYTGFLELSTVHWWVGWIYEYDEQNNQFNVLNKCPPDDPTTFRSACRACGTSSNF